MQQLIRHQTWIVLAGLAVFFTNLGVPQLWDEDEPKNAECAREMMARGDWVVPTFNEQLRYDKPVLLYWLMISAYRTFGVGEFGARFASAVLAIGTTLVTYHLGRLLFRAQVGLWAGLCMASSLMFVVAGRAATPDSTLIFCTTLAMLAFVKATWGASPTLAGGDRLADYLPKTRLGWASVYAAMGLGVLAKGPVAIVLPGGILGLYLLLVRSRACGGGNPAAGWMASLWRTFSPRAGWQVFWSMRPLTGLCVLAAVALPWYALVGLRTDGDWLAGFLGTHNVGRFLKPMEGHRGPIVYYLAAIAVGFFPWSWFFLPSLLELVNRIRRNPAWASYLFVACWAGFYIGFFSLARTKLPSYVLPAYPALALMTGAFIDHWLSSPERASRWMLQTAIVGIAVVGAAFTIAFPLAAPYVLPGQGALGLVGLALVIGGTAGWILFRLERPQAAAAVISAAAIAFAALLFGFASVQASRSQNSARLIALIRQGDPEPLELATFDHNAPSLVFYARQQVKQFYAEREVQQFFASSASAYLITRAECLDQIKAALPADVTELARQPRFLRQGEELVVLGRAARFARTRREKTY